MAFYQFLIQFGSIYLRILVLFLIEFGPIFDWILFNFYIEFFLPIQISTKLHKIWFHFIFMFLYLLSLLLIDEDITADVPTVSIENFCDFTCHLKKANDLYKIEINYYTLVFISTLDGYEASIRFLKNNTTKTIDSGYPNQTNRLIYFNDYGYIKIKATTDNVNVTIHTLPLGLLPNIYMYEQIFISSYPNELFNLVQYKDSLSYGNASLSNNGVLFWNIFDATSKFEITAEVFQLVPTDIGWADKPYLNCYLAKTRDISDMSSINFNNVVSLEKHETKSRLIYITSLTHGLSSRKQSKIVYKSIPNEDGYNNTCINYRAFFFLKDFKDNGLVIRGQRHYNEFLKGVHLYKGISKLDFSIYSRIFIEGISGIYIFPTISQFQHNIFRDTTIDAVFYRSPFIFNSGNDNFVNETDMNVKIILYQHLFDD